MAPLSRSALLVLALVAPTAAAKPALVAGSGDSPGGLFRAGSEGAEFSVCGSGRLRLAPGSELRVFPVSQRLSLTGNRSASTWSVLLRKGRVDVELPRNAEQRKQVCAVLVTAPRKLSTLVLSGHAIASADAQRVTVANLGGESLASMGDGFRPLPEFHSRNLGDEGNGEARPLLGGPQKINGQQAFVAIGKPAAVRWISWQPVEHATGYAVELKKRGHDAALARTRTTSAALADVLSSVEPGSYELSVRALDRFGIEGRATSTELRVIGAEVPAGAFVDDEGTIRLGSGQRVQFSNVDGLHMTYGNAGHYVRASATIGLYRNGPTVVHFRAPGALQTVRARLAPRGLSARVFAGPKTARWPSDPIQLRIRLEDSRGRPLPDWIEARPKVTLGIEPLDVEWTREGRTLRATVPPQATRGPWIVRVDVEDQFGIPLGRDFVEVAPARGR